MQVRIQLVIPLLTAVFKYATSTPTVCVCPSYLDMNLWMLSPLLNYLQGILQVIFGSLILFLISLKIGF